MNYIDPLGLQQWSLQEDSNFRCLNMMAGLGGFQWATYVCFGGQGGSGGGQGGGTGGVKKKWDPRSLLPGMLSRATESAKDAVQKEPCASLFNIGGNGLAPSVLLEKLAARNTGYGAITYGEIRDPRTSAQTQSIISAESSINSGALITINDSVSSNWFLGDDNDRMITILHELAHAYDIMYGAGASGLPANEAEVGISGEEKTRRSMQNSAEVRRKCL